MKPKLFTKAFLFYRRRFYYLNNDLHFTIKYVFFMSFKCLINSKD